MKYILNTGRYAVAFIIMRGKKEFKLELDKRRLFLDTGNLATTGLTPVTDEDIEELKKQDFFNELIEKGSLKICNEDEVKSPDESKIKTLEDENRELKAKLEKAEKPDVKKLKEEKKAVEDENKTLADENASLKAQLEALTKNKEEKADADTAGF